MVLLTHLGLHPKVPFSARQIAGHYRLSPSLTANVLKSLQKGNLVKSLRGVRGGYVLNRNPEDILLSQVIEVLEGGWNMVECQAFKIGPEAAGGRSTANSAGSPADLPCPVFPVCPSRTYMDWVASQIKQVLDHVTLQCFVQEALERQAGTRQLPEQKLAEIILPAGLKATELKTTESKPLSC
ncbi:MAG: Rrf2 family transcriptional regulator [Planctomycetes bacterium]|nr:Rrf2 family transcriptional regulator [Planctomycetota bacterium]